MFESYIINFFICLLFSGINFAYYSIHGNGKKYIRLFSSFVLFVFALGFVAQGFGWITSYELDAWFGVVALLPVLDTIVDWQNKHKVDGW